MSSHPRKASPTVRQAILDALRNRSRRFLDGHSSSNTWLSQWGIKADGLFNDLIVGLESSDHLFLKPKNSPNALQAYQCILDYDECDDGYAAIMVHVTLAPKGEPPRVRVAVHPSDTVRTLPPLLRI